MENNNTEAPRKPIVELENVVIGHDGEPLLKDVSLRLEEGEFVFLIGRSGAGKTSLLRALYGDQPIDGGKASVCGLDVTRLKRRQVPPLRRQIGIVFQNSVCLTTAMWAPTLSLCCVPRGGAAVPT